MGNRGQHVLGVHIGARVARQGEFAARAEGPAVTPAADALTGHLELGKPQAGPRFAVAASGVDSRILVDGAAGFAGARCRQKICGWRHEVVVVGLVLPRDYLLLERATGDDVLGGREALL